MENATILCIIQNIMSKKRFTRLELHPQQNTELIVHQILDNLLAVSSGQAEEKRLKKMSKQLLASEVMYKELNTVGQAFICNPQEQRLIEDEFRRLEVREGIRPFSAKVEKQWGRGTGSQKSIYRSSKNSMRSTHKYSVTQSVKSREAKRYGNFRPHEKFYPLARDDAPEDSFIDSLRDRKAREQAYERGKEEFLRSNLEESEKYPRLNRKFVQVMGSKAYYYNRNGEAVEVGTGKAARRTAARGEAGEEPSKRSQVSQGGKNEVTVVEFQEKENFFRKTRDAFEIEEKPALLFYKSQQCKYQVLS